MKVNANIIKTYKSLHTWTGIISGMALFIAFYAGALTIFKEPISQWATPPTVSATQLEMDEVPAFIATLVKLAPEAGKSIRLNLDPAEHGTHQFTCGGANARFITLVDGVAQPFVADFTGDSGLWDIEQIEVYRGPQSTNNGRNSIAGAMYIQTADPTFDWEGKLRLGYRNKDQYIDKAVVLSGPIIDNTLAFRFSGQVIDGQTITSNEAYDTNPTDIDLNELDTEQGRLKFLWLPTDDLELMFTHAKYNEEGDAGRRYFEDTSTDGYVRDAERLNDCEPAGF